MARVNGRKSNGAHGITDRDQYVLNHTPMILSALLMRRQSTNANELVDMAISTCQRIYDVVHEIDIPAEAMTSQPVDLRT